jgi:hypothetical protein
MAIPCGAKRPEKEENNREFDQVDRSDGYFNVCKYTLQ